MPNCKDCGIQLKDKRSIRCRVCANLGIRNPAFGKKRSVEARLKTSLANKGNPKCASMKGKKHKLETLKLMSKMRSDEKAYQWKGDKVGYRALHDWVRAKLGKAIRCSNNPLHKSTRYHWANISGEYKRDLNDWQELCPSCNFRDGVKIPERLIKRRIARA